MGPCRGGRVNPPPPRFAGLRRGFGGASPPPGITGSERLARALLLLAALLLGRFLLRATLLLGHHTLLSVYERDLRDTETSSSCTACASTCSRASVFRSARRAVRVGLYAPSLTARARYRRPSRSIRPLAQIGARRSAIESSVASYPSLRAISASPRTSATPSHPRYSSRSRSESTVTAVRAAGRVSQITSVASTAA